MDITLSVFEAHWQYAQASRTVRIMDTAQAVIYSQATENGRSKLWNSWTSTISKIKHFMNLQNDGGQRSTLTWNGEVINKEQLIKKFYSMFGRRSVE